MKKHLPIPRPDDPDVWQAMCIYITFEALFLNLEQKPNPGKESPKSFSIPDTDSTTLLFYSEPQFDPVNERLRSAFHASIQGVQSSTHLQSLHYFFYENGRAKIRTEDRVLIIRAFSTWNEGIASLFTVIALSTFGHSRDIPQYLRNKGKYRDGI